MFWANYLEIADLDEGGKVKIAEKEYVLKQGILRQVDYYSENQSQTKDSFSYKWKKRDTYESENVQENAKKWLVERYLDGDPERLKEWLKPGSKFLDAGCGSGYSIIPLLGEYLNTIHYLGVDISTAVEVARERFKENSLAGEFIQANLQELPFSEPTFDVIFSEGVLHHTDSTEKSFKYLTGLLVPGGRFLFYVYKKKSPIREFSDDYIRDYLKNMDDKEAWEALIPLTKLGEALGELNIEVEVPADIPFLDIKAGTMNLQRLFYWHVFKAFYRPDWTVDEMNHVNFDWYRPMNCHRHTPDELMLWCRETGMEIEHMNIQESGITVVAVKK